MSASSNELAGGGGGIPPRQQGSASVVDFGPRGGDVPEPLDVEQVLESVRATAYRWDFATDTIEWA